MRKLKVVTSFTELPISAKAAYCRNVLARMSNNPVFSNPDVSFTDASNALTAFEAAIIAAKDGGHTFVSARNDCERVVNAKFILLAKYVDRIADGDETTILSSGFGISKQPTVPTKEQLTASYTDFSGTIRLDTQTTLTAGGYLWEGCANDVPESETGWTIYASTQAHIIITGLIKGVTYKFRVAAITPAGLLAFSQIVSITVL